MEWQWKEPWRPPLSLWASTGKVSKEGSLWYLETTEILDSALDRFGSEKLSQVSVNTCPIFELLNSEEEFLLIGLYKEN